MRKNEKISEFFRKLAQMANFDKIMSKYLFHNYYYFDYISWFLTKI